MRVFLSYASEDRTTAEQVHLALVGAGIRTFFDKEDLPAGGDFNIRIRAEVAASDLFVFLISPESVARGGYALSELHYARLRWPHPQGRVLPVMVRPVDFQQIPPYLGSVTALEPEGNLAAEVALAVSALADGLKPERRRLIAGIAGLMAVFATISWVGYNSLRHMRPAATPIISNVVLTDQEPAAAGLLVDLDPLTVTWQLHGQPEDVRVSLESLESSLRTDDVRASASEGLIRFAPESYRRLLAKRERGAANRLRAVIRTANNSYLSQPAAVQVGQQILTLADTEGITVAAMIDNARVDNYDFEARVVVPAAKPDGEPMRIGPNIPYRFRPLRVTKPEDYDWSGVKAVYLGPDDSRLIRPGYLIDDALKRTRTPQPRAVQIRMTFRGVITDAGSVPNLAAHGAFTAVLTYDASLSPKVTNGGISKYKPYHLNLSVAGRGGLEQQFRGDPGSFLLVAHEAQFGDGFLTDGTGCEYCVGFNLTDKFARALTNTALPRTIRLGAFDTHTLAIVSGTTGAVGTIEKIEVSGAETP